MAGCTVGVDLKKPRLDDVTIACGKNKQKMVTLVTKKSKTMTKMFNLFINFRDMFQVPTRNINVHNYSQWTHLTDQRYTVDTPH